MLNVNVSVLIVGLFKEDNKIDAEMDKFKRYGVQNGNTIIYDTNLTGKWSITELSENIDDIFKSILEKAKVDNIEEAKEILNKYSYYRIEKLKSSRYTK